MSGNNTVRLVTGGTIQVRTGALRDLGPTGPTGPTGATGAMPVFSSTVNITSVNWGSTASGTISGSGTSSDKYTINLNIPTNAPTVAIGTITNNSGNATASVTGSGTAASPLTFSFNIPAGATGLTGSSGAGYANFNALATGYEYTINTSAAQSAAGTDITFGSGATATLALLAAGWKISGTNVPSGATIAASGVNNTNGTVGGLAAYSVRMSAASTAVIASGTTITFDAPTASDTSTQPAGSTPDTTSSEQGFPIPTVTTKPAIPWFFKNLVKTLDKYVVARFADAAARTTARASRNAGEMTYLTGTNALYIYDGSTDQPVGQVRTGTTDPTGTAPEGTIFIRY